MDQVQPVRRRKHAGIGRWRAEWSLPVSAPAPVDWRADSAVPRRERCPVLTRRCDARGSVRGIALWGRCQSRLAAAWRTRPLPLAITMAHALASAPGLIHTARTLASPPLWLEMFCLYAVVARDERWGITEAR